jgi:glycerophosphoryl diester phosphodiesterase
VAALHRANRLVGVWTVNDAAEARDLAALGVDWLITDSPEAIRTAIRR